MPAQVCTICSHSDKKLIDQEIKGGFLTIRAIAGHFGVKKSAVARHAQNHVERIPAKNADSKAIDREIQRLLRAQQTQRDKTERIAISRELRNWYTLKAKLEARNVVKAERAPEIGRAEALQLARTLIEAEMATGSQELFSWLSGLVERFVPLNEVSGKPVVNHNGPLEISAVESGAILKDLVADNQTLSSDGASEEDES